MRRFRGYGRPIMNSEEKVKALLFEARRWIGVVESSPNSGEMVKRFQLSMDATPHGEPWCVCFMQYCVKNVDFLFSEVFSDQNFNSLPKTEYSLTLWDLADPICKKSYPTNGTIVVWKTDDGGHVGLVTAVHADNFETIEGNTGAGGGETSVDGVYSRIRFLDRPSSLKILGFIDPWKPY